eukprot:2529464-Alexandrium_andersonii.AAC.1
MDGSPAPSQGAPQRGKGSGTPSASRSYATPAQSPAPSPAPDAMVAIMEGQRSLMEAIKEQ